MGAVEDMGALLPIATYKTTARSEKDDLAYPRAKHIMGLSNEQVEALRDDLPPPYSPAQSPVHEDHHASATHTFGSIEEHIAAAKHYHELRLGSDSLSITRGSACTEPRLMLDGTIDTSKIVVRHFINHCSRVAAQARLPGSGNDFEIHTGSIWQPGEHEWTRVHFEQSGGLLHKTESYHFVSGNSRKLVWKQCHDHSLGSQKTDWVLEDETDIGKPASQHKSAWACMLPSGGEKLSVVAGGTAIARFHGLRRLSFSSTPSDGVQLGAHGRVDWEDEHGNEVELAALVTLIAILSRAGRHK